MLTDIEKNELLEKYPGAVSVEEVEIGPKTLHVLTHQDGDLVVITPTGAAFGWHSPKATFRLEGDFLVCTAEDGNLMVITPTGDTFSWCSPKATFRLKGDFLVGTAENDQVVVITPTGAAFGWHSPKATFRLEGDFLVCTTEGGRINVITIFGVMSDWYTPREVPFEVSETGDQITLFSSTSTKAVLVADEEWDGVWQY